MSRRGGLLNQGASQYPPEENGGIPPPSTIAAQIVHNHANSNARQEPQNKAVFGQLLQEFLKDGAAEDTTGNLHLNWELVSVVVRAGLDVLLINDPFAQNILIPQALDSISVIEFTIQKNPELLFYKEETDGDSGTKPQMILWVFPKLISILGRTNCKALQPKIQSLLGSFLQSLCKKPSLRSHALSLLGLYGSCVNELLPLLETPFGGYLSTPFKAILPPSAGIKNIWSDAESFVALPQKCNTEIKSRAQALMIALALIDTSIRPPSRSSSRNFLVPWRKAHEAWALDSCFRLFKLFVLFEKTDPEASSISEGFGISLFKVLEHMCLPHIISKRLLPYVERRYPHALQSIGHFLWVCSSFPHASPLCLVVTKFLLKVISSVLSSNFQSSSPEYQTLLHLLEEHLIPSVEQLTADEPRFDLLSNDLKTAIFLLGLLHDFSKSWPARVVKAYQIFLTSEEPAFEDAGLGSDFANLIKKCKETAANSRPRKKIRTSLNPELEPHFELYDDVMKRFLTPLGVGNYTREDELAPIDLAKYANVSPEERLVILRTLTYLPCAACLYLRQVSEAVGDSTYVRLCSCDSPNPPRCRDMARSFDSGTWGEDHIRMISFLENLVESSHLQGSPRARVLTAVAIRTLYSHLRGAEHFDLERSKLGQWCLRSLHSSLRELRIAAGRAIPIFVDDTVPEALRRRNRIMVLDFLRTLSDRDELQDQETLIMAWGQVARVCGDDELNIVLLRLVEYLGHTNPFVCSTAYNEISRIADHFSCTPTDLFKPFWRSIGIAVVKDLQTRPQKAQQLSDLLEITVKRLLSSTAVYTVPYLVLMKKKDILERVALACGTGLKISDFFVESGPNLAAIVALLLQQPAADVEKAAMEICCEVAPEIAKLDEGLATMVKSESILIACELLKAASDEEGEKKARARQALQICAVLAVRKPGQSKSASKPSRLLPQFFDSHILGIMTLFSEVIDNLRETQPLLERRRCLGGMKEMMLAGKKHVSVALPQIRACLQSAIDVEELCNEAFSCWATLLKVIEAEDVELLIDHTFSIIAQYWESFSDKSQAEAHETIAELLKTHNTLIRDRIDMLPSLPAADLFLKINSEIARLKGQIDIGNLFEAFGRRCQDDNAAVVAQALRELIPSLESNQRFIHESAANEQPSPVVSQLCRAILDASVRFAEKHGNITILCAKCLGLVGCLDPYRVEATRSKEDIVVLSNFERANEVVQFTAFLLENILVPVFHSSTNANAQNFLAFIMQELLKLCGFNTSVTHRARASQDALYHRWIQMPESVRNTLTPFLSSKFMLRTIFDSFTEQKYPIFSPDISHNTWLRMLVYDLLRRGKGDNAKLVFPLLARAVRNHDLSIASFMFPFAALNLVVGGTEKDAEDVATELLAVLEYEVESGEESRADFARQCSENVFEVLDYFSRWLQEKRKGLVEMKTSAARSGTAISEMDELNYVSQISSVERILHLIPAEVMSRRALECRSYARALFHWEQYIRQEKERADPADQELDCEPLYQRLQSIYAQIDEPDSLEGISAQMHILDPEQQVLEHRKAGRWSAVQSWHEQNLVENPNNIDSQMSLLDCLRESGQYDTLLHYIEAFQKSSSPCTPKVLPYAAEAAWATGKWDFLEKFLSDANSTPTVLDFNVGIGKALLALRRRDLDAFSDEVSTLRESVAKTLSPSTTGSLQACHEQLLKLHVLYEVEAISGVPENGIAERDSVRENLLTTLDGRLDILGSYTSDKQYLLGIRRAVMQLSSLEFTKNNVASAWLASAQLARKAHFTNTAFNAVLHAGRLGDDGAKIEHSRLLWKAGNHRKAIQNLEGAIAMNAFQSQDSAQSVESFGTSTTGADKRVAQNRLSARAHLLLAKWLDAAGQTQSSTIIQKYQFANKAFSRWDKTHYHLGKHYNKLLESEKALPANRRSSAFRCGEHAKLVIDNFLRSLSHGSKYNYQTVPKMLTLWLDLGTDVYSSSAKPGNSAEQEIASQRVKYLELIHKQLKKYLDRLPAYIFYMALPQMLTRINHPYPKVYEVLASIIVKVASTHPRQALWSLLAVVKSTNADRAGRGLNVINKLKDHAKRSKVEGASAELRHLITHGQRLSDQLLHACEAHIESRAGHVSLSRDLGFNHKMAPCNLVVPIEATMIAMLPNATASVKNHKAFPWGAITISSFSDDVRVLPSLQRPRKINVRGSDGETYGLLCKPKDDLRKDQRLMEFNTIINRGLQRGVETSKRRLYIKTYAVTPLNEECGLIEWVDGLKPLRDILISIYKSKSVVIDYANLRALLNEACASPANVHIFTDTILKNFPPVLYEWFIETFPEPEEWFTARLRYTRSCAVMSIVGHALGLGDRHGENILLEEGSGGVFHVDFNCLFDKGLTFEKPELVPFRLTHNMADAFGAFGVEGPYRIAAELTLSTLRQYEDTLMTVLETFLYDPTADFIGKKKRPTPGVPETPQEVLDSVRNKLKGFLRGESVPLSVEGYVDALVQQARDPVRLAAMYIGWCAFF